jgi:hypothetical protein
MTGILSCWSMLCRIYEYIEVLNYIRYSGNSLMQIDLQRNRVPEEGGKQNHVGDNQFVKTNLVVNLKEFGL